MRRIGMGALAGMLEFLDRVRIASDREILEKASDLLIFEEQDVHFLELLDYKASLASFERVRNAVRAEQRNAIDIRREVDHFYGRLKDELGNSYFLVLNSDEAKRFTTQRPFGPEVAAAFP